MFLRVFIETCHLNNVPEVDLEALKMVSNREFICYHFSCTCDKLREAMNSKFC